MTCSGSSESERELWSWLAPFKLCRCLSRSRPSTKAAIRASSGARSWGNACPHHDQSSGTVYSATTERDLRQPLRDERRRRACKHEALRLRNCRKLESLRQRFGERVTVRVSAGAAPLRLLAQAQRAATSSRIRARSRLATAQHSSHYCPRPTPQLHLPRHPSTPRRNSASTAPRARNARAHSALARNSPPHLATLLATRPTSCSPTPPLPTGVRTRVATAPRPLPRPQRPRLTRRSPQRHDFASW